MDGNALVEGLKKGDNESRLVFWQRYYEEVYPICARILKSPANATDVAVDLLSDFMNHYVHQLSDPGALHAYLRMMAIRRATTYRNRSAKSVSMAVELEDTNGANPEEIAHWLTLVPRLEGCLGALSPKARQALRLSFGHHQTHVEIGHEIGGSKQYIGRLIKQSLKALKRCMESPLTSRTDRMDEVTR